MSGECSIWLIKGSCHNFGSIWKGHFVRHALNERRMLKWILAKCRPQWPRGLQHELFSPARTQGSWVRIPLETWMSVCIYSVFALSCVGSGLATGWSPVQGALTTVYRITKPKKAAEAKQRAVEPLMSELILLKCAVQMWALMGGGGELQVWQWGKSTAVQYGHVRMLIRSPRFRFAQ
jgi:hypothetical protein